MVSTVEEVRDALEQHGYLPDEGLATSIFLALSLQRPLLLEGEAGVGKTEVAKVLARWTGGELVRLQCYEGIDASQAVYEWDYSRQLLHLRAVEAGGGDGGRGRALLRAVPRPAAPAAGHRPPRRRPAGPAGGRGRPGRRRVRGVPARDPVRLRGDGPRARRAARRGPADRDPHVEPDPGRARRAQAAVPVPLDRSSGLRARARDRATEGARGERPARPSGRGGGRGAAGARALQAAGSGRDHRLGRRVGAPRRGAPRRARCWRRSARSSSTARTRSASARTASPRSCRPRWRAVPDPTPVLGTKRT